MVPIRRSLHPREQAWWVQSNVSRTHSQTQQAGTIDDRCYPFESTSHGNQPAKKDVPRRIGRTKSGLNSKLHAVCDGQRRALIMLPSEGQMSDYRGAALMLKALPKAKAMLADKGYDADWFRKALADLRITACIPPKAISKVPIPHDAVLYKQRHKKRKHVRKTQRLASYSHSIRPLRRTLFSSICKQRPSFSGSD